MTVLTRNKAPKSRTLDNINFVAPSEYYLKNDIPIHVISAGTQDTLKIEVIFKAGLWYQEKPFVAYSACKLLTEGTATHTAREIAEVIDFHGAHIETKINRDSISITLYALNKHLDNLLPLFADIIKHPAYPQSELTLYLSRQKQDYFINRQKVNYIARTNFNGLLYGPSHPYGIFLQEEHFDNLKREDLLHFHSKWYKANNCQIIVGGKVPDGLIQILDDHFGDTNWIDHDLHLNVSHQLQPSTLLKHCIHKEDAVQSAIRIGKVMFNKTHPDFMGMEVLNTILGGYFGSRLMTNIREEKGYTYGISSGLASFQHSGIFLIACQVDAGAGRAAVDEIYHELKKLQTDFVSEKELDLVRGYMLGKFLRGIDGPFAQAETFRSILEYGLDLNFYYKFLEVIKTISARELKKLAETYFREDTMYELIVGK